MDTQSLSEVNVNLLVFAKHMNGNRIYVRGRSFYSEPVWFLTGIKRMFMGDSRFALIEPLRGLVARVKYFKEHKDLSSGDRQQLITNLEHALSGINRLYHDYEGDARFESELQEIIQSVTGIISPTTTGIYV